MNKKSVVALLLVGVMSLGALAGLSAYFTDSGEATNTFTVGKVTIDLDEPEWTPDPDDIVPNQSFDKDPTITNTGDDDAFVYMTVTIPVADVVVSDVSTGTKAASALTDLFSLNYEDPTYGILTNQVNPDWTLLYKEDVEESTNVGGVLTTTTVAHKYTYVYGTATECTALAAGESTTLFDTVTFANIIEGQLEDQSFDIDIEAFAIQAEDLADLTGESADNGTKDPKTVLNILYTQNDGSTSYNECAGH